MMASLRSIAFLILLGLFGCTPPPDSTPMHDAPLRYLALGDSYTIGESVAENERWPVQLAARLRSEGVEIASPEIVAVTGWTTNELDAGINDADARGPYDLVSLLVGVNNQYRGRDVENYRTEFRALLGRAIAFAGGEAGRVVVVSIPDWGVTPFAKRDERGSEQIGAEIERFNAVAEEEAQSAGAHFVDITPVSKTAADDAGLTAEDGLHPSGAMYALWTDLVLPTAREALGVRE